MARVKNPLLKGVSGAVNKQFVLKDYNGVAIMTAYPDMSNVRPSELQKMYREKFTLANAYAKKILMDPIWRNAYRAKIQGMQRANNIAVRDFCTPPSVEQVSLDVDGSSGEHILQILAVDDFKVVEVVVIVIDSNDNHVEKGFAREANEWNWRYVIQSDLEAISKIIVIAKDLPGNLGSKEVVWS
jgi:hypothetical protein